MAGFKHTEINKYICLKIGFKIYWEEFINLAFLACIKKKCSFPSLKRGERFSDFSNSAARKTLYTAGTGKCKDYFLLKRRKLKSLR